MGDLVTAFDAARPNDRRSRRSLLRAAVAGLAGVALGALGRPAGVNAATGDPIRIGQSNDAGATNTSLTTSTNSGTALLVTQNGTATALRGVAGNGIAGFFTSANGSGVSGVVANKDKYAVYAANDAAATGGGAAVRAKGALNNGVVATTSSAEAVAVLAQNTNTGTANDAATALRVLTGAATADSFSGLVFYPGAGQFAGADGVVGVATNGEVDGCGVVGYSAAALGCGVWGEADGASGAAGVLGRSLPLSGIGFGVAGSCSTNSASGAGVRGLANTAGSNGVMGWALATTGESIGVYGRTNSSAGYGVYSYGNAYVAGVLTATGGISSPAAAVVIDHPLDPANKVLAHSLVESADMLRLYSGTVALDATGKAVVALPAWFGAVNDDVRYQLTAIGEAAPDLHVGSKLRDGRFAIAGGAPGQEVSWQLTAVRSDAYARAHRAAPEAAKPDNERGLYLQPVELGLPAEKSIAASHRRGTVAVASDRAAGRRLQTDR